MTPPIDMVTTQGYDLQFGTNVLGEYSYSTMSTSCLLGRASRLAPPP